MGNKDNIQLNTDNQQEPGVHPIKKARVLKLSGLEPLVGPGGPRHRAVVPHDVGGPPFGGERAVGRVGGGGWGHGVVLPLDQFPHPPSGLSPWAAAPPGVMTTR